MLESSIVKTYTRGRAPADTLFFVDLDGKAITLKAAYNSIVALEVYKEMGVPRHTAEQARRSTATRMVKLDLPESVLTGMALKKNT